MDFPLHRFVRRAVEQVGSDNCCVHLLNPDRDRFICQAVSTPLRPTRLAFGLDVSEAPAAFEACSTQRSVAIDEAAHDHRVAEVARRRFGLGACLYVPIAVDGEGIGVCILSHQAPHPWTAEEIERSEALVRELAVVLGRASPRPRLPAAELAALDTLPAHAAVLADDLVLRWTSRSVVEADLSGPERRLHVPGLFLHPERGADLRAAARDILDGSLARYEAFVDGDGAAWRVQLQRRDAGPELLLVATDVTEIAEARAALETGRHLEALGRLSAGVAHEVNNVLQLVRVNVEDLDDDSAATRAAARAAIHHAVDRGATITRQLLVFAGARAQRVEPIELDGAIVRWWPLLRQAAGSDRDVAYTSSGEFWVESSPDELELALLNLLVNARDATQPGGRIALSLERDGDRVALRVIDDGVGMSDAVRSRAVEPFFTTKDPGEGTGLGLATVGRAIAAQGGSLSIASEEGRGTTVSLLLRPVEPASPSRATNDAPAPPTGEGADETSATRGHAGPADNGLRVLYVEDEPGIARATLRLFRRWGHEVVHAPDVTSAEPHLDGEFDVAVLDLSLPDGSGLALADALAARSPATRIVLCTGYADRGAALRAAEASWVLLTKPASAEQIRGALTRRAGDGS